MSDRSTPSQDSPSPAPDTSRGGAIRRGPFPMFLMEIAQSDDADRLLRELDMLKDNALEAADTAIRATDPALADLCDALRWTAADGDIQAITAVLGAWTPRGLLLTATVTVAAGPSDTKVIEHVPVSLVQGGPLLEYVSKDPEALTAALVTRWSPSHVPISASRLRSQVFKGLYTAREQPPPIDTTTPPNIQSQKVSHKIHKPISQFLAPHLRPSWDRLRTREVVAAFGPRQQGHVDPRAAAAAAGVLGPADPQRRAAASDRAGWRAFLGHSPHLRPAARRRRRHRQPPPTHAAQPRTLPHQRPGSAQPRRHSIRHDGFHPGISPIQVPGQARPYRGRTITCVAVARADQALFQPPRARLPSPPGCRGPHASGVASPGRRVAPPPQPFVPDLDVTAYSTDYAQLRDQYEAQQQELAVARRDLESLTRDLDMVRTERDNAQQLIQRSAAA